MKTVKTKATQSDKEKTYCEQCGTFTVRKGTTKCTNTNHERIRNFNRETTRLRVK